MNDDRFGDPVNTDWPMPISAEYRVKHKTLLDWARRVWEWLFGWRESDEA